MVASLTSNQRVLDSVCLTLISGNAEDLSQSHSGCSTKLKTVTLTFLRYPKVFLKNHFSWDYFWLFHLLSTPLSA